MAGINIDKVRNGIVSEYYDNSVMLNVAMNIEYFLCDEVILYPYKNWILGEVVAGPYVKRYFVEMTLRYEYEEMPDPEGMKVMARFGVRTTYKKIKEHVLDDEKSEEQGKKIYKDIEAWYVTLYIPKDLVSDSNQRKELDMIGDMLDLEALENVADDSVEGEDEFNMNGDTDLDNFGDDFGGEVDLDMEVDTETGEGDANV